MSKPAFRYILRYFIDPGFHAHDRLEELVAFCQESQVEEVMLFSPAEELTTGHPTQDEWQAYARWARQVKDRLAQVGVALSLNPWTTLYHVARGRRLRLGQDFCLQVGETGFQSPITACPLCPNWQRWLCDGFALLAREVQPLAIWVEDDWRKKCRCTFIGSRPIAASCWACSTPRTTPPGPW